MINQEDIIDTYCSNRVCINNGNDVFFKYTEDNPHVINHDHQTMQIHPKSFKEIMKRQINSNIYLGQYKSIVGKKVNEIVDQMAVNISKFIKNKFLNSMGESLIQKYKQFPTITSKYLQQKMKQKDIQLLRKMTSFYQQKIQGSFSLYLARMNSNNIFKEIQTNCSQFQSRFIQILDVAIDNLEQLQNIYQNKQQKIIEQPDNCQLIKLRNKKSSFRVSEENLSNNANSSVYQFSHQDQKKSAELPDKNNFSYPSKNKKIKKNDKQSNTIPNRLNQKKKSHDDKIELQSFFPQMRPQKEIQVISQNKICIIFCTYPQKTLEYISKTFSNLKQINIFHHKFAVKQTLKALTDRFPGLERLSLNCHHEFGSQILKEFTKGQIEKMKFLELHWNIDEYYVPYHISFYFPRFRPELSQKLSQLNIHVTRLNNLKNNETVLFESAQQINEYFNIQNIKTVHYLPKALSISGEFRHLTYRKFKHLTTLNLKNVDFKQTTPEIFRQFIKNNSKIKNLIIDRVYNIGQRINNFLSSLKLLQNLQNFSFKPYKSDIQLVNPDNIFDLIHLRSLFLDSVNFKDQHGYKNSQSLKSVEKLKHLKALGVYACNPIFSDFLSYLNPLIYNQIQLLNLSLTQIDQKSFKYIHKMKNITYLCFDYINITTSQLLQLFKGYFMRYSFKWELKYLNIQRQKCSTSKAQELSDMKAIALYLPQLRYLSTNSIAFEGYNFEDFKKLKILAITKHLFKSVHELTPNIGKYVDK